MNGKKLLLVSAALFIAPSMWKFGPSQQAQSAVEPNARGRAVWEYRVVWIKAPDHEEKRVGWFQTFEVPSESLNEQKKKDAEDISLQFNDLASDGWEYAGTIKEVRENNEKINGTKFYDTGAFVLMKRQKRKWKRCLKFLVATPPALGYKG